MTSHSHGRNDVYACALPRSPATAKSQVSQSDIHVRHRLYTIFALLILCRYSSTFKHVYMLSANSSSCLAASSLPAKLLQRRCHFMLYPLSVPHSPALMTAFVDVTYRGHAYFFRSVRGQPGELSGPATDVCQGRCENNERRRAVGVHHGKIRHSTMLWHVHALTSSSSDDTVIEGRCPTVVLRAPLPTRQSSHTARPLVRDDDDL